MILLILNLEQAKLMNREKYQNIVYFWKGKGQDFLRRGMRGLTVVL